MRKFTSAILDLYFLRVNDRVSIKENDLSICDIKHMHNIIIMHPQWFNNFVIDN